MGSRVPIHEKLAGQRTLFLWPHTCGGKTLCFPIPQMTMMSPKKRSHNRISFSLAMICFRSLLQVCDSYTSQFAGHSDTHLFDVAVCPTAAEDVRVAGLLLCTCKDIFWRVSYIAVMRTELYWIPRTAMVFNLYTVLAKQYPTWVEVCVANRVCGLACDAGGCWNVRHAASRIVHRVWRKLGHKGKGFSPAVYARMDLVQLEHVLPRPFL